MSYKTACFGRWFLRRIIQNALRRSWRQSTKKCPCLLQNDCGLYNMSWRSLIYMDLSRDIFRKCKTTNGTPMFKANTLLHASCCTGGLLTASEVLGDLWWAWLAPGFRPWVKWLSALSHTYTWTCIHTNIQRHLWSFPGEGRHDIPLFSFRPQQGLKSVRDSHASSFPWTASSTENGKLLPQYPCSSFELI